MDEDLGHLSRFTAVKRGSFVFYKDPFIVKLYKEDIISQIKRFTGAKMPTLRQVIN